VDAVVPGGRLRAELARRFHHAAQNYEPPRERRRGVLPV
jgi:hypothetical protein